MITASEAVEVAERALATDLERVEKKYGAVIDRAVRDAAAKGEWYERLRCFCSDMDDAKMCVELLHRKGFHGSTWEYGHAGVGAGRVMQGYDLLIVWRLR